MSIFGRMAVCVATALILAVPASAGVSAWFVPSAQKIPQDVKPEKGPVEWDLASARNEVESCQLVLLSDVAVKNVRVSASSLKHSRGKGTLRPELYKVAYVGIFKENKPFPDPLPPITPLDLEPGKAQPIWISVRVPRGAAPGTYRGTVKLETDRETREFPLSVKVWDFALPETPACETSFGIWTDYIALCHGVDVNSVKMKELHRKYYEFLLDHKISAFSLPVDLLSDEAPKYLNDPRMTSFTIPNIADDAQLKKVIDRLIEGGWFKKSFFYWIDEPVNKDAYNTLISICDRLKKVEPESRIIAPFFANPDFDKTRTIYDLLAGHLNLWCVNSSFLDSEAKSRPFLGARKNAGETYWWYVCCGPGAPYNNFFTELPAMSHRTLFWNQKREGITGLLYWATTYWDPKNGCDDPWRTQQTLTTINPNINGDGSLLYPGKKVGVDGPVSSIRLEVIRDGIEDFDYLTLADERLGPDATKSYITKVARTLTDHEQDPAKLEKVRRELGSAIEKATADARRRL